MIGIRDRERDKRIKELSRARKRNLAEICRGGHGGVMPLADYLRWSKDELVNEIIGDEFKAPGVGTRVRVTDDCGLAWLRGHVGTIATEPAEGTVQVWLDGDGSRLAPSNFLPFELEVSR